jgi:hypothetical protein
LGYVVGEAMLSCLVITREAPAGDVTVRASVSLPDGIGHIAQVAQGIGDAILLLMEHRDDIFQIAVDRTIDIMIRTIKYLYAT